MTSLESVTFCFVGLTVLGLVKAELAMEVDAAAPVAGPLSGVEVEVTLLDVMLAVTAATTVVVLAGPEEATCVEASAPEGVVAIGTGGLFCSFGVGVSKIWAGLLAGGANETLSFFDGWPLEPALLESEVFLASVGVGAIGVGVVAAISLEVLLGAPPLTSRLRQ